MGLGWKGVTVVLCSYGFWKELRPSVPFLTPYLLTPPRNFTDADLYSRVYPFWTYSYLIFLIPMFILTDLLRYKPLIIGESLGYIGTWALLIWGRSIPAMQAMQIVYGWATAAEVAYYAYIYAAIDERHYQKATSYVRGIVLAGRCLAYGTGQILISTQTAEYIHLQYISFAACILILAIAVFLPSPKKSGADLKGDKEEEKWIENQENNELLAPQTAQNIEGSSGVESERLSGIRLYFKNLLGKFRRCFSYGFIVKWSLWWAFATSGFFQVGNYIQNLWEVMQVEGEEKEVFNGVTEALSTLIGAGAAVAVQFVHLNWALVGEWVLGVITAIDAVALVVLSQTKNLWLAYSLYILFCVFYQMLITIATYNIACKLEAESYGLVFGWNTFMALILQTLLTFSVADQHGFALDIRSQFLVYGIYHGILGLVFLVMGVMTVKDVGLGQCWNLLLATKDEKGESAVSKVPSEELPLPPDGAPLQGAEVYTTRV